VCGGGGVSGWESDMAVWDLFLTFIKVITCNNMSNFSVAARSKASVCGYTLTGIAASSLAVGMDVCLL
jgi:hypothetical protein